MSTTDQQHTDRTARELIEDILSWSDEVGVTTFEEAGVLTRNEGLIITMEDGTEFQVTVVRSK